MLAIFIIFFKFILLLFYSIENNMQCIHILPKELFNGDLYKGKIMKSLKLDQFMLKILTGNKRPDLNKSRTLTAFFLMVEKRSSQYFYLLKRNFPVHANNIVQKSFLYFTERILCYVSIYFAILRCSCQIFSLNKSFNSFFNNNWTW